MPQNLKEYHETRTYVEAVSQWVIFFTIDISYSMLSELATEEGEIITRFEAAKRAVIFALKYLQRISPRTKIGFIFFNDSITPFPELEVGSQFRTLIRHFQGIEPDDQTGQARALNHIGDHIAKFQKDTSDSLRYKVVLLTDGEETVDGDLDVFDAATRLKKMATLEIIGIAQERDQVNEQLLKNCASVVNDSPAFTFISDDANLLQKYMIHTLPSYRG